MSVYKTSKITDLLKGNKYPGRGIVIGQAPDGSVVVIYFIMGRSENSRNRVFEFEQNGDVIIRPFDESKVEDPSLIIYHPLRHFEDKIIVTNGDQTDTIYDFLKKGDSFENALATREFEPDSPNFTPRISGILENFHKDNANFSYKMSILKSADGDGSACNRYFFNYTPQKGVGHFIHTYECDGNPLPTFTGEPRRVEIPSDIGGKFAREIWESLDSENKISLCVYKLISDGDGNGGGGGWYLNKNKGD